MKSSISDNEKAKRRRRRTFLYLWILLALLVLLVASTYTWFALSRTPKVHDLAMYINADSGLEIGLEATGESWGQRIDFVDMVTEEYPLRPVTWSNEQNSFVTVRYGLDGRTTGEFLTLTDEQNANRPDWNGYYVHGVFYARANMACDVSLAEAVELNDGENGAGTFVIGEPVWDADKILHHDGGQKAETAIRLGFRITPADPVTGEASGESQFFIYEPSCDDHVGGPGEYVPTPSIDGTETLVDEDHLILQGASTWKEAEPVQREVTIKSLGEFYENPKLFRLEKGGLMKIEVYVWLEGQDPDCISRIDDARVLSNIQFHVDYNGQSGLDDIP